ncbi:MAG: SUMF1/EgtB/PvdO family nonheme iron enzyme [Candidatus Methylumidiphilus sp.]
MTTNKPTVFISYARKDQSSARLLAENLRALGAEPWLDENLQAGDDWQRQLDSVLSQCSSCFVLLSPDYAASQFAYQELQTIERHLNANRYFAVFPVLLSESRPEAIVNLPEFIMQRQWINFSDLVQNDQALESLISTLGSASTDKTSEQTQTPPSSPRPLRTKRIVTLPDIDWVEIPAGAFIYGEKSSTQTVTLERFFISRYPITHCQYQTFIDAGGYSDGRWWLDLIKPEPQKPTWTQANRPRETVDWYEAVAFTRWLSGQLGYDITLPTEQQWEKAARGSNGREYPWGKGFTSGYANIDDEAAGDENLQQTSAVGLFPQSASPYQVMDMAGNVWEWCLNKLDRPDQTAPDQSGDARVLRGGSWNNSPDRARSTVRYKHGPVNRRYGSLGFRVVSIFPQC